MAQTLRDAVLRANSGVIGLTKTASLGISLFLDLRPQTSVAAMRDYETGSKPVPKGASRQARDSPCAAPAGVGITATLAALRRSIDPTARHSLGPSAIAGDHCNAGHPASWSLEMNKTDLIDSVADAANLSKADAGRAVDAVVAAITQALKKGDTVTVVGFGTFLVRTRAARTGRNPRTNESIEIAASNTPAFKPGKGLKDALN